MIVEGPEGRWWDISAARCLFSRLSSLHLFHLPFARQGRNHYTFIWIPPTFPSTFFLPLLLSSH